MDEHKISIKYNYAIIYIKHTVLYFTSIYDSLKIILITE